MEFDDEGGDFGCCGRSCRQGAKTLGLAEDEQGDSLLGGGRDGEKGSAMKRCGLGVAALLAVLLGAGALAHQGKLPFWEPCESAQPESDCFEAVMWARKEGIKDNPEWYPGLTGDSSFDDFQTVLFKKHQSKCKKPCDDPNTDLENGDQPM